MSDFARLEELSADWDRLWRADPVGEIFQTFAWHRAWWRAYRGEVDLCCVVVRKRRQDTPVCAQRGPLHHRTGRAATSPCSRLHPPLETLCGKVQYARTARRQLLHPTRETVHVRDASLCLRGKRMENHRITGGGGVQLYLVETGRSNRLTLVTRDLPEIDRVVRVGKKRSFAFSLPMRSNDVVLFTLEKVKRRSYLEVLLSVMDWGTLSASAKEMVLRTIVDRFGAVSGQHPAFWPEHGATPGMAWERTVVCRYLLSACRSVSRTDSPGYRPHEAGWIHHGPHGRSFLGRL